MDLAFFTHARMNSMEKQYQNTGDSTDDQNTTCLSSKFIVPLLSITKDCCIVDSSNILQQSLVSIVITNQFELFDTMIHDDPWIGLFLKCVYLPGAVTVLIINVTAVWANKRPLMDAFVPKVIFVFPSTIPSK